MKGRRKTKTDKWAMKAQLEIETRRIFATRGNTGQRFLDAASNFAPENEPTGRLAGQPSVAEDDPSSDGKIRSLVYNCVMPVSHRMIIPELHRYRRCSSSACRP